MDQKQNSPRDDGLKSNNVRNFSTTTAPLTPSRLHHFRPADLLIPRLDRVRERGPGSWVACCPSHEDKSPSLSIRETADGTLMIKCFSGCSIEAITQAAGLTVANLFPPRDTDDYGPRRKARAPAFPWRDAIKALYHHLLVVQIGAAQMARGDTLSEQDLDALARAALDVSTLIEEVGA